MSMRRVRKKPVKRKAPSSNRRAVAPKKKKPKKPKMRFGTLHGGLKAAFGRRR